jgi:DNA-binding NtrC family response regulator
LNERLEDIPLLADYFINDVCESYNVPLKAISDTAIAELQKINWTGNIREFRNVMERLIILCEKEINASDVETFAQPISK